MADAPVKPDDKDAIAKREVKHLEQLSLKLYQRNRGPRTDAWATKVLAVLFVIALGHWLGLTSRQFTSPETELRVREESAGFYGPFSASQLFASLYEVGNDLVAQLEEYLAQQPGISMEDIKAYSAKFIGESKTFMKDAFSLYTQKLLMFLPLVTLVSLPLSLLLPAVLAATPAASFVLCVAAFALVMLCCMLGITALVLYLNGHTLYAAISLFVMYRLWVSAGQLRGRKTEVLAIRFAGKLLSHQAWFVACGLLLLFVVHVPDLLVFVRMGSVVTGDGLPVSNAEHFGTACQESLSRFGRAGTKHCCTWSWDSVQRRPVCFVPLAAVVVQRWLCELIMPHLVLYLVAHVTSRQYLAHVLRTVPGATTQEGRKAAGTLREETTWEDVFTRPVRHFFTQSLGSVVASAAVSGMLWHGPDVLRVMYPGSNTLVGLKVVCAILYLVPLWITLRVAVAGDTFGSSLQAIVRGGLWGMMRNLVDAFESTVLLLSIISITSTAIMVVGAIGAVYLFTLMPFGDLHIEVRGDDPVMAKKVLVYALLSLTCSTCMGAFFSSAICCLVVMFMAHRECQTLFRAVGR